MMLEKTVSRADSKVEPETVCHSGCVLMLGKMRGGGGGGVLSVGGTE